MPRRSSQGESEAPTRRSSRLSSKPRKDLSEMPTRGTVEKAKTSPSSSRSRRSKPSPQKPAQKAKPAQKTTPPKKTTPSRSRKRKAEEVAEEEPEPKVTKDEEEEEESVEDEEQPKEQAEAADDAPEEEEEKEEEVGPEGDADEDKVDAAGEDTSKKEEEEEQEEKEVEPEPMEDEPTQEETKQEEAPSEEQKEESSEKQIEEKTEEEETTEEPPSHTLITPSEEPEPQEEEDTPEPEEKMETEEQPSQEVDGQASSVERPEEVKERTEAETPVAPAVQEVSPTEVPPPVAETAAPESPKVDQKPNVEVTPSAESEVQDQESKTSASAFPEIVSSTSEPPATERTEGELPIAPAVQEVSPTEVPPPVAEIAVQESPTVPPPVPETAVQESPKVPPPVPETAVQESPKVDQKPNVEVTLSAESEVKDLLPQATLAPEASSIDISVTEEQVLQPPPVASATEPNSSVASTTQDYIQPQQLASPHVTFQTPIVHTTIADSSVYFTPPQYVEMWQDKNTAYEEVIRSPEEMQDTVSAPAASSEPAPIPADATPEAVPEKPVAPTNGTTVEVNANSTKVVPQAVPQAGDLSMNSGAPTMQHSQAGVDGHQEPPVDGVSQQETQQTPSQISVGQM